MRRVIARSIVTRLVLDWKAAKERRKVRNSLLKMQERHDLIYLSLVLWFWPGWPGRARTGGGNPSFTIAFRAKEEYNVEWSFSQCDFSLHVLVLHWLFQWRLVIQSIDSISISSPFNRKCNCNCSFAHSLCALQPDLISRADMSAQSTVPISASSSAGGITTFRRYISISVSTRVLLHKISSEAEEESMQFGKKRDFRRQPTRNE